MDYHRLQHNLEAARARVVQGQRALLQQRRHVRDLEQVGLDSSDARTLLWIYEQSQTMNLFERDRLRRQLAGAPIAPSAAREEPPAPPALARKAA